MPIYIAGKGFVLQEEDLPLVLETARKNGDSWKRCQILAEVAWHTKDAKQRDKIIEEALETAREQEHPNRVVTLASWPVSVMAAHLHKQIGEIVDEMLSTIAQEPNAVRRGDALLVLFEAVYLSQVQKNQVLNALLKTCEVTQSWKRDHMLAETAIALALDDLKAANHVIGLIQTNKFKSRARRQIESGIVGPHSFFPFYERTQQRQN